VEFYPNLNIMQHNHCGNLYTDRTVVLNQGDINKFQGGTSPYTPYNMESLIIKFTFVSSFLTLQFI